MLLENTLDGDVNSYLNLLMSNSLESDALMKKKKRTPMHHRNDFPSILPFVSIY